MRDWLAQLVRDTTYSEWPKDVVALAGAWPDFPTVEELRNRRSDDVPRETT